MDFLSRCHITRPLSSTAVIALGLVTLSGCQSLQKTPNAAPTPVIASTIPAPAPVTTPSDTAPHAANTADAVSTPPTAQFTINGKIGVTTPKQAGSAFYVWSQQGQNFAINLAGALNAGETNISYNGQSATLTNDKGTINAATPEALLLQATGWQAPISQLSYWIQGQSAPSDSHSQQDPQSRLISAQNGDWQAQFSYANTTTTLPSRLTARHPNGYKVVMTINPLETSKK